MSESAPAGTAGNIEEEKIFAALSWWFFLGPIFLFIMKEKKFVRHHAAQGTVMLAVSMALGLLCCGLSFVLSFIPIIGWLLSLALPLLGLIPFAGTVMGTIKALQGEWWECPVLGGWAKKIPV